MANSPLLDIIDEVGHSKVGEPKPSAERSCDCEKAGVFIPGGPGLAGSYLPVPVGQAFVVIREHQNLTRSSESNLIFPISPSQL